MGRGRGTWDAGTWDLETRGLGDAGTWGRGDAGTQGRGDAGHGDVGTRGRGDARTSELRDAQGFKATIFNQYDKLCMPAENIYQFLS